MLDSDRRAGERQRGRTADAPQEIPPKGWKDVLSRTWREISEDRVTLVAAGATYYLLLAIFPTLTALVSIYGLFADPRTVAQHVELVSTIVPAGGLEIINEQLTRLTQQRGATLGLALVVSLGLALWSSSAGVKTMFEAMNIAYGEREERGFIRLTVLALAFTLAGIVVSAVMLGVVVVLPAVLGFLGLPPGFGWLVQSIGYLIVVAMLFLGILALYRFGPDRQQAKWRWLIPGAVLAVLAILVISVLFSWYSANFANFDKTYGSLGALIGFLTWIWLTVTIVLVGAELNAELEHQTAKDSTVGADHPMGRRDAQMADTLGRSVRDGGIPARRLASASPEWQAGFHEGARLARKREKSSPGGLLLAVPAALALMWLDGRRRDSRRRPQVISGT